MSVILSCKNLTKSYYARPLFDGLTFGVFEGDRIGVIGANGAGKSTFLRILAGLEQADEGEIARRRGLKVAYIEQSASFAPQATCTELVKGAAREAGYAELDAETKAAIVMSQLQFADPDTPTGKLSGGWRKRLQLACAIVTDPDLLLLDEPTNHLDIEAVLWLEDFLKSASFAWVMVSHDRQMLERTTTKIAELSRVYPGGVLTANGHYADFLEKRADYLAQQAKLEETMANQARREIEWLRRGPAARTTKAKYRVDEAKALIQELSELRSRMRTGQTEIEFGATGRKTRRLIVADAVAKTLGERKIVDDLSLVVTPGLCLGVVGANGTGKTSVLKLLRGDLTPDAGRVIHADGLRLVYFDQNRDSLDKSLKLRRYLSETGESVVYQGRGMHIISWVKKFQFRPEQLDLPLGDLSGGEQARALIAKLMLEDADILMLDEPTNDLDIQTLETLEDSLAEFPGAVILVSHDRYLMNKVCNLVVGLDGKGGSTLYADFDQWEVELRKQQGESRSAAKPKVAREAGREAPKPSPKRLSYMEQREYDQMEQKILAAETALEEQQAQVDDPALATSPVKLNEAYDALRKAQEQVDKLYARWSELEGKLK